VASRFGVIMIDARSPGVAGGTCDDMPSTFAGTTHQGSGEFARRIAGRSIVAGYSTRGW